MKKGMLDGSKRTSVINYKLSAIWTHLFVTVNKKKAYHHYESIKEFSEGDYLKLEAIRHKSWFKTDYERPEDFKGN
jgi:hypothetical protein